MRTLVALASAAALAGCAAAPEVPPEAAAVAPSATQVAAAQQRPLTGSRLTRSSTDRALRTIGQQELDSEHPITSLGNEVGPRTN